MTVLVATPAYARDYKSRKDVLSDWHAGKDFQASASPYFSIRDLDYLQAQGIRWLNIRYKSLSEICVIKIGA